MKLRKGLVSVFVLTTTALAACGQKVEATKPSVPTADGETPAASPAGERTPHTINTGEPIDGEATLKAPAQVAAGATFEIDWSGPGNAADYVDIVPRGYTETSGEITHVYAKDAVLVAVLNAPMEPGEYDIRYLAELNDGRTVKATVPVTVTPVAVTLDTPPPPPQAAPPCRSSGPARTTRATTSISSRAVSRRSLARFPTPTRLRAIRPWSSRRERLASMTSATTRRANPTAASWRHHRSR